MKNLYEEKENIVTLRRKKKNNSHLSLNCERVQCFMLNYESKLAKLNAPPSC